MTTTSISRTDSSAAVAELIHGAAAAAAASTKTAAAAAAAAAKKHPLRAVYDDVLHAAVVKAQKAKAGGVGKLPYIVTPDGARQAVLTFACKKSIMNMLRHGVDMAPIADMIADPSLGDVAFENTVAQQAFYEGIKRLCQRLYDDRDSVVWTRDIAEMFVSTVMLMSLSLVTSDLCMHALWREAALNNTSDDKIEDAQVAERIISAKLAAGTVTYAEWPLVVVHEYYWRRIIGDNHSQGRAVVNVMISNSAVDRSAKPVCEVSGATISAAKRKPGDDDDAVDASGVKKRFTISDFCKLSVLCTDEHHQPTETTTIMLAPLAAIMQSLFVTTSTSQWLFAMSSARLREESMMAVVPAPDDESPPEKNPWALTPDQLYERLTRAQVGTGGSPAARITQSFSVQINHAAEHLEDKFQFGVSVVGITVLHTAHILETVLALLE